MDLVKDLMTPNPFTVLPTANVGEAARLMDRRRVRHVPIADPDGRLVGLVSQRDLLRTAWQNSTGGDDESWRATPISNVMRTEIDTAQVHDTGAEAARLILSSRRSCLPVVDADGKLVGILTEADYVRRILRQN
ncbi:MAG: CBS domain-containing protein [Deltaproteobacteria bacterium]|nr:CBS domain-containing protein [Deltaproteobacteria bacterium]